MTNLKMRGSELSHQQQQAMTKAKLHRSIKDDIKEMIKEDYSMITGEKVRNMFADDVVKIIEKREHDIGTLKPGQVLWYAVNKNDKWRYGKNATNTQLIPVKLTLITPNDLELLASGYNKIKVRENRAARLFFEAYNSHGGLLSTIDVGFLLNVTPSTISTDIRRYMDRENVIVPTRGNVQDIGRATTHKRIIVKLYIEGYFVPEIARKTGHSEDACDRYIRMFNKVKMLNKKGLNGKEIAQTLSVSKQLVKEYLLLIKEFLGGEN